MKLLEWKQMYQNIYSRTGLRVEQKMKRRKEKRREWIKFQEVVDLNSDHHSLFV